MCVHAMRMQNENVRIKCCIQWIVCDIYQSALNANLDHQHAQHFSCRQVKARLKPIDKCQQETGSRKQEQQRQQFKQLGVRKIEEATFQFLCTYPQK